MEKELFDWEDWDPVDTASFQFYRCVLKRGIGPMKAVHFVDIIYINYESGVMDFYDEEGDVFATFKLGLVVLPE